MKFGKEAVVLLFFLSVGMSEEVELLTRDGGGKKILLGGSLLLAWTDGAIRGPWSATCSKSSLPLSPAYPDA